MKRSRIFLAVVAAALSLLAAEAQTSAPAKPKASAAKAPAQGPASNKAQDLKTQDLAAGDLRAIQKPPLPEFHPQQPKRVQFDNGMVVFLQEDHELPLIEASITIRGGSKSEPEAKTGLVGILGGSWRTGGTKTRTGDQLDDLLEARAARLETQAGQLSTFVSLSSLKGDFDYVLDLANDLIHNPEFRQEKIDLAKDQLRTG